MQIPPSFEVRSWMSRPCGRESLPKPECRQRRNLRYRREAWATGFDSGGPIRLTRPDTARAFISTDGWSNRTPSSDRLTTTRSAGYRESRDPALHTAAVSRRVASPAISASPLDPIVPGSRDAPAVLLLRDQPSLPSGIGRQRQLIRAAQVAMSTDVSPEPPDHDALDYRPD